MIKAELLSIGDELLIGQVINTNVAAIAKALGAIGIDVHRTTTVGDTEQAILKAMRRAWSESDVVIATGGLGPTHDDISKKAVAKFFKRQLWLDPASLRHVKARFKQWGYQRMPEGNEEQALIPEGFEALRNTRGTAPGLWYREKKQVFVILPGVPHEMAALMKEWVIPKLRGVYGDNATSVIQHLVLQTSGIGESVLAKKIGDVKAFLPEGTTLAYLPRTGGVRLRISVRDSTMAKAKRKLAKAAGHIRESVGKHVYGEGELPLEHAVVAALTERGKTVSTAESCTGGMLSMRLTNVSGSSQVFPGGLVSYADAIKMQELGISKALLQRVGAVSEEVALAMAESARKKFATDFALAITGIAGPDGGTAEKPVGTVWIALAETGQPTTTKLLQSPPDDRSMIRERSTEFALEFLRQRLLERDV